MILAAVGGIWVPVFIMPHFLRQLSVISPLNWGLNGYYDILVRYASLGDVLHYAIWLVLFSVACLLLASLYQKYIKERG